MTLESLKKVFTYITTELSEVTSVTVYDISSSSHLKTLFSCTYREGTVDIVVRKALEFAPDAGKEEIEVKRHLVTTL